MQVYNIFQGKFNRFTKRRSMPVAGFHQTQSWHQPVNYCLVVTCIMFFFTPLDLADGISWHLVPDEHMNVKQGSPFNLRWQYKMDENETFLSSEIKQDVKQNSIALAARHMGEHTYYKYQLKIKYYPLFSISGKNDVTLMMRLAPHPAIGQNITYCCEVAWKSANGKIKDKRCSRVFVYVVPRITYHIQRLSCKQGDSIRLQCNATGIPTPYVDWIHDEKYLLKDRSSELSLNISGKGSEGRYCCDAKNGFGSKRACTAVNVNEYEPENTTLLVKQTNKHNFNIIHIICKANASPPPNNFIININNNEYNSSDGLHITEVTPLRNKKNKEMAVSCIPCNKYGRGTIKRAVFKLYVPPRFSTLIPTQYRMTYIGITIKCPATGIPTPTITWTSGDTGNIVGTEKYFKIPYEKCVTKTLTFYCHARNAMGNITSPLIHVKVMTMRNCSNVDKDLDPTTPIALKNTILIGVVTATVIAVITIVAVAFCMRRINKSKCNITEVHSPLTSDHGVSEKIPRIALDNMDDNPYQNPIDSLDRCEGSPFCSRSTTFSILPADTEATANMDESPYQDPIDTVVPERGGSRSFAKGNILTVEDGYETVGDCASRVVGSNREEDPQYETLPLYMPPSSTDAG